MHAVRCIVQPLKNVSLIYDVTYLLGSVADLVLLNNFDRKQSLVLQVAHEVHCAEGALAQQTHRFEVVNRHFLFGSHVTQCTGGLKVFLFAALRIWSLVYKTACVLIFCRQFFGLVDRLSPLLINIFFDVSFVYIGNLTRDILLYTRNLVPANFFYSYLHLYIAHLEVFLLAIDSQFW